MASTVSYGGEEETTGLFGVWEQTFPDPVSTYVCPNGSTWIYVHIWGDTELRRLKLGLLVQERA